MPLLAHGIGDLADDFGCLGGNGLGGLARAERFGASPRRLCIPSRSGRASRRRPSRPPSVLRTPCSNVYNVPSGSAVAGLGWSSSSHRSRKCCWQALCSESVRPAISMNSWGDNGVSERV